MLGLTEILALGPEGAAGWLPFALADLQEPEGAARLRRPTWLANSENTPFISLYTMPETVSSPFAPNS